MKTAPIPLEGWILPIRNDDDLDTLVTPFVSLNDVTVETELQVSVDIAADGTAILSTTDQKRLRQRLESSPDKSMLALSTLPYEKLKSLHEKVFFVKHKRIEFHQICQIVDPGGDLPNVSPYCAYRERFFRLRVTEWGTDFSNTVDTQIENEWNSNAPKLWLSPIQVIYQPAQAEECFFGIDPDSGQLSEGIEPVLSNQSAVLLPPCPKSYWHNNDSVRNYCFFGENADEYEGAITSDYWHYFHTDLLTLRRRLFDDLIACHPEPPVNLQLTRLLDSPVLMHLMIGGGRIKLDLKEPGTQFHLELPPNADAVRAYWNTIILKPETVVVPNEGREVLKQLSADVFDASEWRSVTVSSHAKNTPDWLISPLRSLDSKLPKDDGAWHRVEAIGEAMPDVVRQIQEYFLTPCHRPRDDSFDHDLVEQLLMSLLWRGSEALNDELTAWRWAMQDQLAQGELCWTNIEDDSLPERPAFRSRISSWKADYPQISHDSINGVVEAYGAVIPETTLQKWKLLSPLGTTFYSRIFILDDSESSLLDDERYVIL